MAKQGSNPIDSLAESTNARLRQLEETTKQMDARLTEHLDALTVQVGTFTEGLTRLENLIERGFGDLDRKLDRIAATLEKQQDLAVSQQNLAASQQQTVNRLVEMAASQQMLVNQILGRAS